MPDTFSPQAHARSAKSALNNALRLLDPLCTGSADDACRQADAAIGDLEYALEQVTRVRAMVQLDIAMKRAKTPERVPELAQ